MTQLTVRAYDEERQRSEPTYTVCVARGRAFVRPFRPEWAAAAERLEAALNARLQPQARLARAAEQEIPLPR
jgi:hypothetical protein